jgi:hypothetical protein
MPRISVNINEIKFFDKDGEETTNSKQIKLIRIPVKCLSGMPNMQQQVGIGMEILGGKLERYVPALVTNSSGQPPIYPPSLASPEIQNAIQHAYAEHKKMQQFQETALKKWGYYLKQAVALQDVTVSLSIGKDKISQTYDGTLISGDKYLPDIVINEPTIFTINMIKKGNFDIMVQCRIVDSNLQSASACIDYAKIVNETIKESQQVITRNKSMGIRFWGIGFSKDKFEQTVNYDLAINSKVDGRTGVNIIYDDATEDLIAEFQKLLFPYITKQETIDRHEEAAIKAEAQGDVNIAKLHRSYADALRKDDKLSQEDILTSAAALSTGNYAAFIASGVRGNFGKGDYANNFTRVISRNFSEKIENTYAIAKRFSIMRTCQLNIKPKDTEHQPERIPYIGSEYVYLHTKFNQPQGIVLTGIADGSPLMMAGFQPGMLVTKVNFKRCYNFAQFNNALDEAYRSELPITYVQRLINPFGQYIFVEKDVNIYTKSGYKSIKN